MSAALCQLVCMKIIVNAFETVFFYVQYHKIMSYFGVMFHVAVLMQHIIVKIQGMFFSKQRSLFICDVLCHLAPFVQFKKPENNPWRSVPFIKLKGVPFIKLKEALLHQCFSRILNRANGTKSSKTSHIRIVVLFVLFNISLFLQHLQIFRRIGQTAWFFKFTTASL